MFSSQLYCVVLINLGGIFTLNRKCHWVFGANTAHNASFFPNGKRFQEGECFLHDNMVSSNPWVFEPCNINLDSGSNIHIISMLACDALIENAIVVTFVDSEVGLSGRCLKIMD